MAAQATGFPAIFIVIGIVGVIVAAGVALGGKKERAKERAKRTALWCAGAFVGGIILASLF